MKLSKKNPHLPEMTPEGSIILTEHGAIWDYDGSYYKNMKRQRTLEAAKSMLLWLDAGRLKEPKLLSPPPEPVEEDIWF